MPCVSQTSGPPRTYAGNLPPWGSAFASVCLCGDRYRHRLALPQACRTPAFRHARDSSDLHMSAALLQAICATMAKPFLASALLVLQPRYRRKFVCKLPPQMRLGLPHDHVYTCRVWHSFMARKTPCQFRLVLHERPARAFLQAICAPRPSPLPSR